MKKLLLYAPAVLFIAACTRPAQQLPLAEHSIAFYNLENLFDTEDDPTIDDAEYLPTSDLKWTPERYQAKLKSLAKVIGQLGDEDGPELLGVCEVENRRVLQDLIDTEPLSGRGYAISHFDSKDARGIDVALLYKPAVFRLVSEHKYTVQFPNPNFRTRDILMTTGVYESGDTLSVLVNHWPSRRGGAASEVSRMTVAKRARAIVDSLNRCCPSRYVLLMGDFNDEPTDKSITEGLRATDLSTARSANGQLHNAMYQLKQQGRGSHSYNRQWSMLDQIILSPNFLHTQGIYYLPGSANTFYPEWVQDTGRYAGNPLRTYAGKKYLGGYSDHLAVYIKVQSRVARK